MRLTTRAVLAVLLSGLMAAGLGLAVRPAAVATDMAAAVAQATAYAGSRGVTVGISVYDRDTGQVYENGQPAHTRMRSASVPKILVATSLLERSRRGEITLAQADRDLMWLMVARSDDAAMSNLYSRFGGQAMVLAVAAEYGLTEIGTPPTPSYWGMWQITANDITKFYRAVVTGIGSHLHPADRDQLIAMMRAATHTGTDGFDQYFGIPYALPYQYWGIKQGWMCCQEGMRWLHTTGILGQDNRFTVSVLSRTPQSLSYAHVGETLTSVVRTLFPGGTVPPSGEARNPVGQIDVAYQASPGRYVLSGWTADHDDPTRPLDVHVYVDGVLAAYGTADRSRPDVAAVLAGYGDAHGYELTVPVPDGRHTVCVYAINVGAGTRNPSLGCPVLEAVLSPIGNFEAATAVGLRGMQVSGWTADLEDPTAPTDVVLSVDGTPAATVPAGGSRPDVGAAFPGTGSGHGFSTVLGMAWPGRHVVCATAVNVPGTGGRNTSLGCRVVTGPTTLLGSFDVAAGGSGTARVTGWAVDALVPAPPVSVHVYADGRFAGAFRADTARPDVGAVYPEAGGNHGFDASIALAPGSHTLCVFGIYADSRAANPLFACRTATVT
ncbi:serine hydrolase [Blastococcus sp. SYSU D00669]